MALRMGTRIICAEIGSLPARIGGYRLSASAGNVPLRMGAASIKTEQIPLPATAALYNMSSNPSPGALAVRNPHLPIEVVSPFILAGEKFKRHLDKYCEAVIFTPYLTWEGEWADGFEIEMTGVEMGVIRATLLGPDLTIELSKTMFINLYDAEGNIYQGPQFHWVMSRLLGRMMINPLLIAKGMPVEVLGPHARTYFSTAYQREMTTGIVDYLAQKYGRAFDKTPDRQFYDEMLTQMAFVLSDNLLHLIPNEIKIIESLLESFGNS